MQVIRGVSLRPYEPADLPALADLWVESWQATMPAIDFDARRPWICERLATQAESGTVTLCAVDADGEAQGFAMIEPDRNYLEQLVVRTGSFGSGVARMLLDEVKRLLPAGVALRVNQDNRRAVRFYTREGFHVTAEGTNPGGKLKTWDMAWEPPAACR